MNNPTTLRLVPAALALGLLATACASSDAADEPAAAPDTTETPASTVDETAPGDDDLPLGAGPYPIATLEIEVTHPDADPVSYTVSCLGDTATVTGDVDIDEQAACTALAEDEAKARLVDGVPEDRVCTEIYGGPDEAHVTGTFDDATVDTVIDRANGCGVDDWDRILGAVLPSAIGVTE
ncbi:MAG: hypothetical protein ACRBI6_00720 [Acidimicrobiales bacterium]